MVVSSVGLIGVALIAQFLPRRTVEVAEHRELRALLPIEVQGWKSREVPIAETEIVRTQVVELLNYSDAVQRSYQKGEREFTVYTAYWAPARMQPRLIADHIPDHCWVFAGWKMYNEDYARRFSIGSTPLWPAQYRDFSFHGENKHVLYWHIMGGKLSGFAQEPRPRWAEWLREVGSLRPFAVQHEQYFIRISSSSPLQDLWNDPGFQEVMGCLVPLGLAAKS